MCSSFAGVSEAGVLEDGDSEGAPDGDSDGVSDELVLGEVLVLGLVVADSLGVGLVGTGVGEKEGFAVSEGFISTTFSILSIVTF